MPPIYSTDKRIQREAGEPESMGRASRRSNQKSGAEPSQRFVGGINLVRRPSSVLAFAFDLSRYSILYVESRAGALSLNFS